MLPPRKAAVALAIFLVALPFVALAVGTAVARQARVVNERRSRMGKSALPLVGPFRLQLVRSGAATLTRPLRPFLSSSAFAAVMAKMQRSTAALRGRLAKVAVRRRPR